jgi:hypothetical protein
VKNHCGDPSPSQRHPGGDRMLQNLNGGTERERMVFAMRDTRWDDTRWTKVFARIASVSDILLGFFYLGGTKVQKGGSLFPNPFRTR